MKIIVILILCSAFCHSALPDEAVELTKKRNDALSVIDQKYKKALEELKVKYTKKGDLQSAVAIHKIIESIPDGRDRKITGKWVFRAKAHKKRNFEFKSDRTFTAQYAVSGKNYSGNWEWFKDSVLMRRKGEKEVFTKITFVDDTRIRFHDKDGHPAIYGDRPSKNR